MMSSNVDYLFFAFLGLAVLTYADIAFAIATLSTWLDFVLVASFLGLAIWVGFLRPVAGKLTLICVGFCSSAYCGV